MEALNQQFRTHIERPYTPPPFETIFQKPNLRRHPERVRQFEPASNTKVRESLGYSVSSFRDLVSCVSRLASDNPQFNLYYRGQVQDYKDQKGRSKIYPSLYRPKSGQSRLLRSTIQRRIEAMKNAIDAMREGHRGLGLPDSVLSDHDEYYQALLQHYEIRETPLVDVTVSLRVAASFALADDAEEGFLYVLDLPLPTGSISHFVDANIVLVRLQSVCPAVALRPHYQEGYLVGQLRCKAERLVGDNLAKRLIGKYRLENPNGVFWDKDFSPIPRNALLPEPDLFGQRLRRMLSHTFPNK